MCRFVLILDAWSSSIVFRCIIIIKLCQVHILLMGVHVPKCRIDVSWPDDRMYLFYARLWNFGKDNSQLQQASNTAQATRGTCLQRDWATRAATSRIPRWLHGRGRNARRWTRRFCECKLWQNRQKYVTLFWYTICSVIVLKFNSNFIFFPNCSLRLKLKSWLQ